MSDFCMELAQNLARFVSPIFRAAISGWPEFQPEKSGWPDGPLARGPGIFISPKARGLEIFQPDPTLTETDLD